jgi:hypothetical protein
VVARLDLASGTEPKFDTSRPGIGHSYTRVRAEQLTGERHQPKLAILEGDHPRLGGEGRENHEVAAVLEDFAKLPVRGECVRARDRDRLIDDGGSRGHRRTRYRETQDTSNDGKRQSRGLHGAVAPFCLTVAAP